MKNILFIIAIVLFSTSSFASKNMPKKIKMQPDMGKFYVAELDEMDIGNFVLRKKEPRGSAYTCFYDYKTDKNIMLQIGEASYKLVGATAQWAADCQLDSVLNSKEYGGLTVEFEEEQELSGFYIMLRTNILNNKSDKIYIFWVPNGFATQWAAKVLERY